MDTDKQTFKRGRSPARTKDSTLQRINKIVSSEVYTLGELAAQSGLAQRTIYGKARESGCLLGHPTRKNKKDGKPILSLKGVDAIRILLQVADVTKYAAPKPPKVSKMKVRPGRPPKLAYCLPPKPVASLPLPSPAIDFAKALGVYRRMEDELSKCPVTLVSAVLDELDKRFRP